MRVQQMFTSSIGPRTTQRTAIESIAPWRASLSTIAGAARRAAHLQNPSGAVQFPIGGIRRVGQASHEELGNLCADDPLK